VTLVRVSFVDVYVLRQAAPGLEILVLRRGPAGRSPASWETVHGTVEPGETPVAAARRELREETGCEPIRLYNASRVESFYRHRVDEVALGPVFVAFVDRAAELGGACPVGEESDRIGGGAALEREGPHDHERFLGHSKGLARRCDNPGAAGPAQNHPHCRRGRS